MSGDSGGGYVGFVWQRKGTHSIVRPVRIIVQKLPVQADLPIRPYRLGV